MTIDLYHNASDNKVINKKITKIGTKTGTVKDDCDVLSPSILVDYVDVTTFNYVYIPVFKRYYYVTGYDINANDMLTLHLAVDVMMTYRSQIMSSNGIVVKSQSKYQMRLNDSSLHCTQDTIVTHINFPNAFKNLEKSFVLVVAGANV